LLELACSSLLDLLATLSRMQPHLPRCRSITLCRLCYLRHLSMSIHTTHPIIFGSGCPAPMSKEAVPSLAETLLSDFRPVESTAEQSAMTSVNNKRRSSDLLLLFGRIGDRWTAFCDNGRSVSSPESSRRSLSLLPHKYFSGFAVTANAIVPHIHPQRR